MASQNKHPKGLYVLFSTEMWERFNFYGMRAIFALFITECLGFSTAYSSKVVGGFLGLSYLSCLFGGYLADNVWGNKKCLTVGGITAAIGQFFLFFSASTFQQNLSIAITLMWVGLIFLIIGVGLFKPNISGIVGMLYKKNDSKLDSAYTIFYMGINLGAFIGMSVCSILGDVKDVNGLRDLTAFKWGFLSAGIAMLIGVIVYLLFNKKYLRNPNTNEILGLQPNRGNDPVQQKSFQQQAKDLSVTVFTTIALWLIFYFLLSKESTFDVFAFIYGFIYSLGIALVMKILFDKNLTKNERNRVAVIIICSFFVIFFWAAFEQAATSLTYIADKQTDTVIGGYPVPPSLIQNANSFFVILLSPLIGWFWIWLQRKKIEPLSYTKQAIGILMLALGYFIIANAVKDLQPHTKMSAVWLFVLYFFHTTGELCLSPIGLSLVYRLAPKRLLSVLMGIWFLANAAGYALSGTLGALLPPTQDKFEKATALGINLESVLTHPQQATPAIISLLQQNQIPYQYPSIIGIPIHNLYGFFICFVVICIVASVLLFSLSKRLQKMEYAV